MNTEIVYCIGELGEKTGLKTETIRFYEKLELMPVPNKKMNGHRIYKQRDLDRLLFIVKLKKTSMTLQDIKQYLSYSDAGQYEECYNILQYQQKEVENELKSIQSTYDLLSYKIGNFKTLIETTRGVKLNEHQNIRTE
ncbi:MerR family transcriptional regulator [Paenibacillus sp. PK4536]|uniref:Putative HTH-type transcriptional regulator YyaN n=1 Tax=Paenibacillus nuruki TaxID=1886670 RepID=A0A1E3KZD5_9BACL|nr:MULTISPECIES: MerR family transcriptional regulator [Paenibacillus]ODP26912.1 putative HTH-type transcriptional regulator YyaN [Paenibacillus nuruki]WIM38990.1 MerR family transcriptional regulator [Paenibacillus sp. PK4536]